MPLPHTLDHDWVLLQDIDVPLTQHCLSRTIDETSLNTLQASAPDSRSQALALSTSIVHAGDWLNVVPSPALGLHMQDREFHFCLQYWLGLKMFDDRGPCPVCHSAANPYGDRQIGCSGNPDRIHHHNSVRDAIFSAAQAAALALRWEVPSLIPGTQSRPADVFLPNWARSHPAALNITIISPLQQATLQGAATTQNHALLVGEAREFTAHDTQCQSAGITFIPITFEALGGMSSLAADTIAKIGRLLGQRLGLPPQQPTHHLFQWLSVSLWRCNAALWIHRSPFLPLSWIGFLDSLFVFCSFFCFVLFVCVCVHLCFPCFSLFCLCLAFLFYFFSFHGPYIT